MLRKCLKIKLTTFKGSNQMWGDYLVCVVCTKYTHHIMLMWFTVLSGYMRTHMHEKLVAVYRLVNQGYSETNWWMPKNRSMNRQTDCGNIRFLFLVPRQGMSWASWYFFIPSCSIKQQYFIIILSYNNSTIIKLYCQSSKSHSINEIWLYCIMYFNHLHIQIKTVLIFL